MAGCATINGAYCAVDRIASENRFKKEYIKTDLCVLTTFCKFSSPDKPLTIYIEGDGSAWSSRNELSENPTPRHPIVLSLAVIDSSGNVAYLARPGQFTASGKPDCDPAYWSEKRFSKEVISAINSVICSLKIKSQSKEINLVGYSGGAAIAVLIAAQRNDVTSLRTIAGNLDPKVINRYHDVSPFKEFLNPIDYAAKISYIPQRHFAAANDRVVPIFVTRSFAERIGDKGGESITIVKGARHSSGWQKAWPSLLKLPLYKNTNPKQ